VKKNIEFTLEHSHYDGKKSNSEIKNIIDLVGLNGYEDHIPNSKSNGFIFRISIANALITNPDFILLDEPFRNFTSLSRSEVYQVLINIKSNTKVNFILATTNILEAIYFSDMVCMMQKNPGLIFDSIKIDGSKISAKLDINDYTSEIIMEIQNRFSAKKES
jgi:ABC-type nitrate/sulfonate/bicarbonate transport system ATPase subunit